jgi:hypothetical protein
MALFVAMLSLQPVSAGLVGLWEFESAPGGLTPDSSGNGHSATLEGNANLAVDPERGSVLELSGLGTDADAVNINSTLAIPTLPANGGATLAAWIKRNDDASAGDTFSYVLGLGNSGDAPVMTIGIADATGLITGYVEGVGSPDTQVVVTGDTAVVDGVWTHIAVTYDRVNNEAITYVNGVAQGTPTNISAVGDGALDWSFATSGRLVNASGNDVFHFGGLIDDVYYYDDVLTPVEIQTLASVSTSGTLPSIVGLSPADGASEVALSSDLVATLSEPLALTGAGTVTIRNLTLGSGADVTISLPNSQVSVSGADLMIAPTTDLDLNTSYAIRISGDAVEDISGDAFAGIVNDGDWNFMTMATVDSTVPTILSTVPADGAGVVDPSSDLAATFDESVALTGTGSVTIRNLTLGSGADTVISLPDARVSVSGTDLTINPAPDLNSSTAYSVRISADAVEDLSSNAFAGIGDDSAWNFTVAAQAPEGGVVPGAWSLVVLPDTQKYADTYPGIFSSQTAWIRDNVRRRNIRYVMHLGDITDDNNDLQWRRARVSMGVMDGAVPYTIVGGNHDYGPNGNWSTHDTLMNNYFSYAETSAWPTFGGAMEVGKLDNTYHLFEAGGVEWIIFNLEFGPRDSTLAWARGVYDLHPARKGILITHAYMNNNDLRYDITDTANSQQDNPHTYTFSPLSATVNDGQEIWDKFVKDYNFGFVINGHVLGDGTGYLVENNLAGDPVHQILVNYQLRPLGGDAYMRILEFQPDGQTVKLTSYSPIYGSFDTASDQQFNLQLPLGAADADNDGVLDYYDPDFDTDSDGRNNYDEFVVYGTHSDKADSDGDGIGDDEEIASGTDPLRSDAATIALVQADPVSFGLFTEQMILDLNPDTTFRIIGNEVSLDLQMRRSDDLTGWIDEGAPFNWTMPKQGDRHFYRVQINGGE